jgi:cation:H+ antiporter
LVSILTGNINAIHWMESLWVSLLIAVIGLAVLIKGSDLFVDAAEKLGLVLGLSPFIIGVLILGIGTSLPELAASLVAVLSGDTSIVAGNAIGSNIANIALIVGFTAFVAGNIDVREDISSTDLSFLVGSSLLIWFVFLDGAMTFFEAVFFVLTLVLVIVYTLNVGGDQEKEEEEEKERISYKDIFWVFAGLAMVIGGAKFAVDAIINLSAEAGVSTEIISLGMVALGTSLPELAVSITAAKKGKPSVAIGNVIGSNLFNAFAVLGIPALIATVSVSQEMISIHIPFLLGLTLLFSFMCIAKRFSRWEGALYLIFYAIFIARLLDTSGMVP